MTIVAQTFTHIIGVDTHARTHTLCLVHPTGHVVDTQTFPTSPSGLARALNWMTRHDPHSLVVIEGIGSYGAGLARLASRTGFHVVEPSPMPARVGGKDDPRDAARIARSVLGVDTTDLRQPRADDGLRAAIRVLVVAREHMSTQRTATVNALTALARSTDLGIDARHALTQHQIRNMNPPGVFGGLILW